MTAWLLPLLALLVVMAPTAPSSALPWPYSFSIVGAACSLCPCIIPSFGTTAPLPAPTPAPCCAMQCRAQGAMPGSGMHRAPAPSAKCHK